MVEAEPVPAKRFWTPRRIVAAVIVSLLLVFGTPCAIVGSIVWRSAARENATMKAMRELVDSAYPDYTVVDSTRSGYVLQSETYPGLRLDARFFRTGEKAVWPGVPYEQASDEWSTHEAFFRHAEGMPEDPENGENYDVAGFVEAYEKVRPGPNSVVSAVWLEDTDAHGMETYVVLAARRDRVGRQIEPMWPDNASRFHRNSKTGEWTGYIFFPLNQPVDWHNTPDLWYYDDLSPEQARDVARQFVAALVLDGNTQAAYDMRDPETWKAGDYATFEAATPKWVVNDPAAQLGVIGYQGAADPYGVEVYISAKGGLHEMYYLVEVVLSPDGTYHPTKVAFDEQALPGVYVRQFKPK